MGQTTSLFTIPPNFQAVRKASIIGVLALVESAVAVLGSAGPIQYHRQQTAKARATDAGLIVRARRLPLRKHMQESGASLKNEPQPELQHSSRVRHPSTRPYVRTLI